MYVMPEDTRRGLDAYLQDHIPPGGFLQAVLLNDLYLAVSRADERNLACLRGIVGYVDAFPRACRGSAEAIREWLKIRVV